jgi:molecular chaperone GrpE
MAKILKKTLYKITNIISKYRVMDNKEIPVDGPEKEAKKTTEQPQTEKVENELDENNENVAEESGEELKKQKGTDDDGEKLASELSEMKDKYLRLYAEFDNYRKRTMREREELIKTAAESAIKSVLSTLDDLERAIKAAKSSNEESTILEGIMLIYEKMFKTLEQQGLKVMDSDGQDFNPDLHEALTKIPVPSDDLKGKVIETIEKGYYLRDKIIRYAKVVVGQ